MRERGVGRVRERGVERVRRETGVMQGEAGARPGGYGELRFQAKCEMGALGGF